MAERIRNDFEVPGSSRERFAYASLLLQSHDIAAGRESQVSKVKDKQMIRHTALMELANREDDKAWILVVLALLTNSVLRGLRTPNYWACTQILINYDFGLVKRGLQGAILSALSVPNLYSYDFCFWYGTTFLAIDIALVGGLLWRLCMLRDANARLTACVFASSFAVVILAHTIGYWDQIGLLVTLLLFVIRNFYFRAIMTAVLFSAIMLIYEGLLPIFFPLIFFRFLVDVGAPIQKGRVVALSLLCICVLTMFAWIGTLQISEASAIALGDSLEARAEYPAGRGVAYTLMTTNTERVSDALQPWLLPSVIRFALSTWIVTLPTIAYLIHGTLAKLAHLGSSRVMKGMAVIASLSPLSLHAVGFDYNRWTTLTITTSLLVFAVTTLSLHTQADTFRSATRRRVLAATAVIGLNIGASINLFDGYIVDNFPYPRLVQNVINLIAGKESFPPVMERCSAHRDYCYTVIDENGVPEPLTLEELLNLPPKYAR